MYKIDFESMSLSELQDRLQVVEEYAYHMDKILNYIITDMEDETGYVIPPFLHDTIHKLLYRTIH